MKRATKTDVKREAQRVFGFGKVDHGHSDSRVAQWMCRVWISGWARIDFHALTKQGALQDAFDTLSKLERKP